MEAKAIDLKCDRKTDRNSIKAMEEETDKRQSYKKTEKHQQSNNVKEEQSDRTIEL